MTSMTYSNLKNILPIYNNEEKVDEINRLLDILSKRKRYSILLAMLLVFQKYNFQKLLKEFLFEGVQQLILSNPFKVVSFGGIPFTVKNCLTGMRVIIGKHKMIQREMFDGYEYLNVNLVYTSIFLTDEIAKICKGTKNRKPVHSSLLDELDIIENNTNNDNAQGSTNNINSTNNNNFLNEKRNRSKSNSQLINYSEQGTISNNKYDDFDEESNDEQNNTDSLNHNSNIPYSKSHDIISLGDSDESDVNGNNHKHTNNAKKKKRYNKNHHFNNKNTNSNNIFENIFHPNDINYFRCPLQNYFNVWNFDRKSPVNSYLNDNLQNINKIKNIFNVIQTIGSQGKNYIQSLMKYIPELNRASSLSKKKFEISGDKDIEYMKESKDILDKIDNMNKIYQEYEDKKMKLINIHQRIKSTVFNIKQSEAEPEKLFLNDDIIYLKKINKRFDETLSEIIPLFSKLYDYNQLCSIKEINIDLQNVSRIIKENDLELRPFSGFAEGLEASISPQPKQINTVNDLILDESLTAKEREEVFKKIIIRNKTYLINLIENYINRYEDSQNVPNKNKGIKNH